MPKKMKKNHFMNLNEKFIIFTKKITKKFQNSRLAYLPIPIGQGVDYWGYESHLSPTL
jgi:hypothetical protein